MDRDNSPDRAYNIRDVADLFSVSDRQVWRLIASGELKAERLSARCVRIFDSEIRRFRESRQPGRAVEPA